MKTLGALVQERNIIIKGGDALSLNGFTQVPNAVLKSDDISSGVFVDADPGLDVMAAVAAGGDLKCQALVAHRVVV